MEYYIYMTNDCNMDCAYCSVLFDTKKYGIPMHPEYSFEKLEQFVTKTQKKFNEDTADIYFFGGEPTIDYPRIEALIDTFGESHDYKINYIMHTNGLLLNSAPTRLIKKVKLTILSFNYELMYSNNGLLTQYFKQMISSIEHIKSISNSQIIGRITVSPKTSLYTEGCLICNFVDYVYWQIDNCKSWGDDVLYQKQYKYEIELLFNFWLTCLRKGIFLRLVPFMSATQHLFIDSSTPSKFYCGYGDSMIYVQTNGNCYACCDNVSTNSHYIGNINDGIIFPQINLNDTICCDCQYIKLCGGRCGRMHKDFTKERRNQYCELNKFMFDLVIAHKNELSQLILSNPINYKKLMDPMIKYTEYTS